jgi:peptidyl-prolyl cis-trans isomerase C
MTTVEQGLRSIAPSSAPTAGRKSTSRLRHLMARILREPLVHFFLVGLILFVAADAYKHATNIYRIDITPERIAALELSYQQQFGAAPTPAAREALIGRYVDEEVLFREGLAMGLDRGDEIVRRRVVQKMQFLQQDLAPPREPTEQDLRDWYNSHLSQYAVPSRVSFTHIFFSPDKGGDAGARERASAVLAQLTGSITRAPERGDNFPDLYDYTGFGPSEASRLFGATPLAQALFTAPTGRWVGPYQSGYGWHLLFISARRPPQTPPFDSVRDQVRADRLAAGEAEDNHRAFEALKARFVVVRHDRNAPS